MRKFNTVWDPETYVAICEIKTPDGYAATGFSACHPNDVDMVSEKTGCQIAERRAYIDYLKHTKKTLNAELKILKKFYNVVNQSKYYNEADYTNQMLIRHISRLESDIDDIKQEIDLQRSLLQEYLDNKEKFYQSVRKNRKDQNSINK